MFFLIDRFKRFEVLELFEVNQVLKKTRRINFNKKRSLKICEPID